MSKQRRTRVPGTPGTNRYATTHDGKVVILGGDPDEIREKSADTQARIAIHKFNSGNIFERRKNASAMLGIPLEQIEDAKAIESGNNVKLDVKFRDPGGQHGR